MFNVSDGSRSGTVDIVNDASTTDRLAGFVHNTAYYRPVRRKPLLSGLRNFGPNRETLMPLPFCYMSLATSTDHSRVPAT
jgi:hypothetical protein